jgi:hypothetical protein
MKKLLNAVFAALLITAPALAGDAPQWGTARAVPAANNMATALVSVGQSATKLVSSRAGRSLLQIECFSPLSPPIIGETVFTSSPSMGFALPLLSGGPANNYGVAINNYAGPLYAVMQPANPTITCNVMEIY